MEVNQRQLAKILGITDRRVRQLKDEGFFFMSENGRKYILEKCVPEYIDYKIKAETEKGASILDKEKEQAEHERIKKQISMLKLRRLRTELHEAKDVEVFLTKMLTDFRNHLLSLPSKIAVQIAGETDVNKLIKILQDEVLEALDELSDYDPCRIDGNNPLSYDDDEEEEDDE